MREEVLPAEWHEIETPAVLKTRTGREIKYIRSHEVRRNLAILGEKAGIERDRRHPHVFRHGFTVNAVLSCVPPLVLRRWLGHASIDCTLIYTEVLAQDTKGCLDKMRF